MVGISWKAFELKHPKATEAFETLCYFLFCRKYNLGEGVRTDFNQVGLETEPIKNDENKYCGFQAKFFEKNISYDKIADSIDKALNNYDKLDHIIIYLNQPAKTSCRSAKEIVAKCKKRGITVEWFLPANFLVSLNQPNNLDLAEFYFGKVNALKLLSDSKSIRMNTLLQAKGYIELNLQSNDSIVTVTEYCESLLKSKDKLHLFTGEAGAGKSVCMWKLFNIFGGFGEKSEDEQIRAIGKVGAICKFINLNNTSPSLLEQAIADNSTDNNYIYLLDGLDEIPVSSITSTLLFVENLLEKDKTKKVVISSRLSSYNKYIFKATFPNISEFTIMNISQDQIHEYFENKGDDNKKDKLRQLSEQNHDFYERITDILTLSLLWEHIFFIKDSNFFTDLMEVSVSTILNDIHHKKYLEDLNLPNPKASSVIEINKALAFYLFENNKFCFAQNELQDIISGVYPKCDYTSINEVTSYISDIFFDIVITESAQTFSYRHRRFAEYFTLLCLENIIQKDLSYLRKNNIIISYDLFEKMLIPYLQKKATREKDLPLAFEVGLFNVYLGNDRTWGIDKEFYYWSRWIIHSIAELSDDILQNVVEDKALPIRKFFYDVPEQIIYTLTNSEKLLFNDGLSRNYINFILLVALIHKSGKETFIPELLTRYEKINALCTEKQYYFSGISNSDNYQTWRCLLYINTVIYGDSLDARIENVIEISSEITADNIFAEHISIDILYFSSLYYNLLLYLPEKCPDIIDRMNLNQLGILALAASNPECLAKIVNDDSIIHSLKAVLENQIEGDGFGVILCLALKKMLGFYLTDNEIKIVNDYFDSNEFKSYSIFWKEHCDVVGFILTVFNEQIKPEKIDATVSRYASVYNDFYRLLNGSISISRFVSCAQKYYHSTSEEAYYVRILLGKALALSDADETSIKGAVDYLNNFARDGRSLIIYHTMKWLNPTRFNNLISGSAINKLNSPAVYSDIDYTSTSDLLFMLSSITSSHDKMSGYELLLKGISNGMMRMNDRKDTIGDYKLLEGLEVILKNNWISTEELVGYLERILSIANKMSTFHIENDVHGKIMEILLEHDFDAAEYYYSKISKREECYNSIHYDFANGLVCRGRDVDEIEDSLNSITVVFDRYHQKISWDGFYFRISIYLSVAKCDFYSTSLQNEYFMKAREEIDELERAGWDRELKTREYELYTELCNMKEIEVDVAKEKDSKYSSVSEEKDNNVLEVLNDINSSEELKEFISKLRREYQINSIEINDMLINKSLDLLGNIDDIINVLSESNYPSNLSYSANSYNFWMTVVSALKNTKAKGTIFDYLVNHGGGHDGFSEIIKIYGYLGNKNICLETFDKMMDCIDFLLS